jgi:hypothetical protein
MTMKPKVTISLAAALLAAIAIGGMLDVTATHSGRLAAINGQAGGGMVPLRVSHNAATALDGVTLARMDLARGAETQARAVLVRVKQLLGQARGGVQSAVLKKHESGGFGGPLSGGTYYPVRVVTRGQQPAPWGNPAKVSADIALLPRGETMHAIDTAMSQIDRGNYAAADRTLASIDGSILYGTVTEPKLTTV